MKLTFTGTRGSTGQNYVRHRRHSSLLVSYRNRQVVVDGDLVKVMSWYDNEWGYASQMIREAVQMVK